jgi:Flp pilus assembly protein TadD
MTTALAVETGSEAESLRDEILQHYEALAGQGHAEEQLPADPKAEAAAAVERAIAEAEDWLGHGDAEAAIAALHPVVIRADGRLREQVRLVLARAYTQDARYRTYAVRLLREMLQERPDAAEALVLQASLYHREGLLARAESTLRRALASDPGHAGAKAQLGAVIAARQRSGVPQLAKPTRKSGLLARLLARRA